MKKKSLIALLVLLAVNFMVVWGQSFVSFWKWRTVSVILMPESRYYLQCLILLLPAIPVALLRFRHGRKILVLLVAALVAHAAGYLVKAHVPGARRNQHVAACDWAVAAVRADYKGPARDAEPLFTPDEYHPLKRPVVDAHTARVAYLAGGRQAAVVACGLVDVPDYIVDETNRVNRDWWCVADYEVLAERKFGKRDFIIYKRIR